MFKPVKPLSGFIELLPYQQKYFDECSNRMKKVLDSSGFSHIDLPSIERAEVLTDKDNWDEIETQMFLFQKADTKMGLRYDGTVGLSRYVAGHINDLVFPFRAYQFAKNYRGERPQHGRYREFYQLDVDILGIDSLSENYDLEIILSLIESYKSIEDLIGEVSVKIGNRKFWDSLFNYLNLDKKYIREILIIIDKKDKIKDYLKDIKSLVGEEKALEINKVFTEGYRSFLNKDKSLDESIFYLDNLLDKLNVLGIDNAEIDLSIVRGHAYYTGVVFEFFSKNFSELGAIGGGGRYENLVSKFSKTKIIGVGAAVGFSRLIVGLIDSNKLDLSDFKNTIDVALLIMNNGCLSYGFEILSLLKQSNIYVVPYLEIDKKFKNKIEFADKINAKFSIIIGNDEITNKTVSLKNMKTGLQLSLNKDDLIEKLKEKYINGNR